MLSITNLFHISNDFLICIMYFCLFILWSCLPFKLHLQTGLMLSIIFLQYLLSFSGNGIMHECFINIYNIFLLFLVHWPNWSVFCSIYWHSFSQSPKSWLFLLSWVLLFLWLYSLYINTFAVILQSFALYLSKVHNLSR